MEFLKRFQGKNGAEDKKFRIREDRTRLQNFLCLAKIMGWSKEEANSERRAFNKAVVKELNRR